MIDDDTLELTAELAAELDRNGNPVAIDPASIPTRYSLLKRMALSPAHYFHACQSPQDDTLASRLGGFGDDRSGALRFGTAVHLFLLGDAAKVGRYSGRRAGNDWKKFQAERFEAGCIEILNDREWGVATAVATAIKRNATAMRLLFDGTRVEERIDWSYSGKACRSTPDARAATHIADLKTSVTAEPGAFVRQALRMHYHAQLALYSFAVESTGSPRPSDAFLIVVEKSAPYPVTILRLAERALDVGERLCRLWIEQLLTCEASGQWPEYLQTIGTFDLDDGDDLELEIDGKRVTM